MCSHVSCPSWRNCWQVWVLNMYVWWGLDKSCAAYGMRDITCEPMRDITCEPMWSSEELKNKSKMTLEGLNPTAPPLKRRRFNSEWVEGCEWPKHDNENGVIFCEWCRGFDRNEHRNWFVKGCALMQAWEHKEPWTLEAAQGFWGCTPCWHHSFDAQPTISQWWKAGPRCRHDSQPYGPRTRPESDTDSSTSESDLDQVFSLVHYVSVCVCLFVLFTLYVLAKVWQPKLCNGNLIRKLVDTTSDLAIKPNFTHLQWYIRSRFPQESYPLHYT